MGRAEIKQTLSAILGPFAFVLVVESIGFIPWIDPVLFIKKIQSDQQENQIGNTPALKEVRKGSRDANQDGKEYGDTGSSGDLEKGRFEKKSNDDQKQEGSEYTQDSGEVMPFKK
ncbi:MAG: hypothetical protein EOP04_23500 [Proteobacteria bacterium]|nr:MAG: hypothetical protein EOP04_23500 [Pseudomonadota bacterium]